MKRNIGRFGVVFLALALALSMTVSSVAAAKGVTITGKIEHGKLVADNGRTYTLSHNFRGRELIHDHTGERVEVHGTLSKTRAKNIVTVDRIDRIYG